MLNVTERPHGDEFSQDEIDCIRSIADSAAIAIANARLYSQIGEERDRMLGIEDEVHKKLARDFHDGPAQTLASLIMDIEFIQKLVERDPSKVKAELLLLNESARRVSASNSPARCP